VFNASKKLELCEKNRGTEDILGESGGHCLKSKKVTNWGGGQKATRGNFTENVAIRLEKKLTKIAMKKDKGKKETAKRLGKNSKKNAAEKETMTGAPTIDVNRRNNCHIARREK